MFRVHFNAVLDSKLFQLFVILVVLAKRKKKKCTKVSMNCALSQFIPLVLEDSLSLT